MATASVTTWGEGTRLYIELHGSTHHKAESTRAKVARLIRDFAAHVGLDKELGAVRTEDVEQYIADRSRQGLSAWSLRDDVVKLRGIWRWMKRRGYTDHNPFKAVERIAVPSPDPRPPSIERVRTLRAWLASRGHTLHLHLMVLAMNLDLRVREMLALATADVKLDEGLVWVRSVKPPHKVKPVRLNAEARAVLQARAWEVGEGLLFRSRSGGPLGRCAVSHRFKHLARAAGCEGVTLHSLRKLCASENGKVYPDRLLMQVTRHDDVRSVAHYVRVDPPMPVVVR